MEKRTILTEDLNSSTKVHEVDCAYANHAKHS